MGLILVALLIIALFGLKEYFRTPRSMMNAKADWTGSDRELAMAFEINEKAANARYLGKVLQVTGFIDNVSSEGDSIFNLVLGVEQEAKVSCTMSPSQNENVRKLRIGDRVSIRGECAGYLADVELNRCVLVKQ